MIMSETLKSNPALQDDFQAMANDENREEEALEWAEATIGDAADSPVSVGLSALPVATLESNQSRVLTWGWDKFMTQFVVTVVAIIAGPVLAVQAQKWLDNRRALRDRQLHIFRILMATRATSLSPGHVEALNLIDIEFRNNKPRERRVTNAWKVYLDNLSNKPEGDDETRAWATRNEDLLTRLLWEMGNCLGYDFDEVHIRRGAYIPIGLSNIEREWHFIRQAFVKVLGGETALPMRVTDFPLVADDASVEVAVRKLLPEVLDRLAAGQVHALPPSDDQAPTSVRRPDQVDLIPKK
jgi:hypothetical protein